MAPSCSPYATEDACAILFSLPLGTYAQTNVPAQVNPLSPDREAVVGTHRITQGCKIAGDFNCGTARQTRISFSKFKRS